jgi:hypothetical protein
MVHQDIRIVILHSNRLFRETLALVLAQQKGIFVICTAAGLDQIHTDWTVSGTNLFLVEVNVPTLRALEEVARQLESSSGMEHDVIGLCGGEF